MVKDPIKPKTIDITGKVAPDLLYQMMSDIARNKQNENQASKETNGKGA